jgi:dUTPase
MLFYSSEEMSIPPGKVAPVPTDLKIRLPPGTYGKLETYPGLALKHHIKVSGAIDEDFRSVINFKVSSQNYNLIFIVFP